MEIRLQPEKTAGAIISAIETAFQLNSRKQVFQAIGNAWMGSLAIAPSSEYIDTGAQRDDWRGLDGIRREYWRTVPGYADRVADHLLAILQGEKRGRV